MSTATGRQAEAAAAAFLIRKGCRIIAQNWRTRRCEIDIVAERAGILYICEVKYRLSDKQGAGLDYITSKKLAQMRFAAGCFVHAHAWNGQVSICAIEVSGPAFRVTAAITDL
ncbi:MAG: YraN family protein [Candidatus Saccharimonadales bacterium]